MKICFNHAHAGLNCPKCLKESILEQVADLKAAMATLKKMNFGDGK